MWPLIIGAVSQATDPAKKLADDYCAYVISQGGVVDYATVLELYQYELANNADINKIKLWWDVRAGKSKVSDGVYNGMYSLIYPYFYFNCSGDRTFGVTNGYPTSEVAIYGIWNPNILVEDGQPVRFKKEFQIKIPSDVVSNAYLDIIRGTDANGSFATFSAVRYLAAERFYSYLYFLDGSATNFYVGGYYGEGEYLTVDIVDFQELYHFSSFGAEQIQLSFGATKEPRLPLNETLTYLFFLVYGVQMRFAKYYKL